MFNEKETTAVTASAPTEARQPSQPITSITETTEKIKTFDESFDKEEKEMRLQMNPLGSLTAIKRKLPHSPHKH